jgi:hypothetical protein
MQKRTTVAFEADLHRALLHKARETEKSLSELVNDAVRESLAEDADDLEAFGKRESETNLDFADVLKGLRKRGWLS